MDMEAVAAEVNASIAAAQPKADATPKVETDADAQPAEGTKETESADAKEAEKPKEDKVELPNAVKNALARAKSERRTALNQLRQAEQRLAQYESAPKTPAPKESEYEGKTYGELTQAQIDHAVDQKLAAANIAKAKEEADARKKEYTDKIQAHVNDSAKRAMEVIPDFQSTLDSVCKKRADGSLYLPLTQDAKAALEASDETAFALNSIIKDGLFDELNSLSREEAAMMVRDHEIKGVARTKTKKVSTAPEPISAAKGTGSGGKQPEQMSAKELLALARK